MPFSFANENVGLLEAAEVATQVVVETTDVATQAYVEATENTVVEGTEISTQTENTDVDQIYSIISPAIQAHGVTRVLLRLRQVITVITESILSSDEEEEYSADTPRSTDSVDTLEDVPTLEYRNETSSVEYTERSPETPERSPVTRSPETPGRGRSPDPRLGWKCIVLRSSLLRELLRNLRKLLRYLCNLWITF